MQVRHTPRWGSLILALAGGLLLDLSAPGVAWWPAGIIGAAFVFAALWQQSFRWGALVGLVAGAAFWGPHIFWLTLYLGPVPWLALCAVMVFWFVLSGAAISFTTQRLARLSETHSLSVIGVLQVLSAAGLWVLREQVQSTWPYGGFAWGRLAHSVSDAPGVGLVSWIGFAGVSGLLAAFAAGVVALLYTPREAAALSAEPATARSFEGITSDQWATANDESPSAHNGRPLAQLHRRSRMARLVTAGPVRRRVLSGVVIVLSVGLVLTFTPAAPVENVGELRVAAVQGNSKSAIFDDRESGDVLRDHIDGTVLLLDQLEARGESVDVIVWPENSAEFELPSKFFSAQEITRLAARADAPIVIGTILANDGGSYSNSSVVYDANGKVDVRYDKRRPVPFAEYMPNRDFFRALAPELVDLVQLEYAPGERSAVLPIETGVGEILAGIAICFDIIFDDQAVALAADGAQVIFAQTNNADFGETDQSAQQLQIARLRAVEMGRTVVNISTVGTSAIVAPDGDFIAQLEPFTADTMVATVPLREGETPALRWGAAWATLWMSCGLLGLGIAVALSFRSRLDVPQ